MTRIRSKVVKHENEHADPIRLARRKAAPVDTAVDWRLYRQHGPSCDMDDNGDPKPPKVTER